MKEKTDKILTFGLLGIAILAIVFAFFFALNTTSNSGLFDIAFWMIVCMIGVSIIAALFFLFKSLYEKGNLVKFFIGLAAVVVVLLGLYFISSGNDVPATLLEKNNLTEASSKWIGAVSYLVYIIVIGAAALIVYAEVSKSIKKK